ncbi:hypothetical protein STCU_03838 [Strigomonas culicis]|uniref:Uncharacterized protein n=1 Tax=Strigomonas culicis TaxID=28005 RepID=S9W4Q9_9TRYP|nr:hypothetical protein STCU_03838 [Strigomonas culicis]|eukprot:EPY30865.1 hypothetical protein STCU_03838 [Strigomonas culicis]
MTVVFPTDEDIEVLSNYMTSLRDISANDENSLFLKELFSNQDVSNVKSSCESILKELSSLSSFFSAGNTLSERDATAVLADPTTFSSGSVFPHYDKNVRQKKMKLALSELSPIDLFGFGDPFTFFESKQATLEASNGCLQSAKGTLQDVNSSHAFIWTTNIASLQDYVREVEKRRRKRIPLSERAQMRAVGGGDDDGDDLDLPSEVPNTLNYALGVSATGEYAEDTNNGSMAYNTQVILALNKDSLPSMTVRCSYAKFIQTANLLLEWYATVLSILRGDGDVPKAGTYHVPDESTSKDNGTEASAGDSTQNVAASASSSVTSSAPKPRSKTVRVTRYKIHDVTEVYESLYYRAQTFFLPEFTRYDPRIGRRLLDSFYYYALRDLIEDFTIEIRQLEDIMERRLSNLYADNTLSPHDMYERGVYHPSTHAESGARTVFSPPLSHFYLTRNALRIYLSTCINENDRSSFLFFQDLINKLSEGVEEVAHMLHDLPMPPPGTTVIVMTDTAPAPTAAAGTARAPVVWKPAPEERTLLLNSFQSFIKMRDRVKTTKEGLAKDIKDKNRSSYTRTILSAVENEKDAFTAHAEEKIEKTRQRLEEEQRKKKQAEEGGGFLWGFLKTMTDVATCKAEINLSEKVDQITGNNLVDDAFVPLTKESPYCVQKRALLEQVRSMWSAMEDHATELEQRYNGIFFRDLKKKLGKQFDKFVDKASSMSVVFQSITTHTHTYI